jgi:hypothetical protein
MFKYLKDKRIRWQHNWLASVIVSLGSTAVYFILFIKQNLPEDEALTTDVFIIWFMVTWGIFFLFDIVFTTFLDISRAWLLDRQEEKNKQNPKNTPDKNNSI